MSKIFPCPNCQGKGEIEHITVEMDDVMKTIVYVSSFTSRSVCPVCLGRGSVYVLPIVEKKHEDDSGTVEDE